MKPDNAVKAFYNKFPYPAYDIKSIKDLKKLTFQNKLFKITKRYLKKGKVLDAGCGTGELALLFASCGFKSFGIDNSEESLKIARNTSRQLLLPATFKIMDVLNVKFPKNSFDAVIANGVLHHTNDPNLGFKNLLKITKPGGIILVVVYNKLGSTPRKLLGKAARLLGGNSIDTQIKWLKKSLPKRYKNKPNSVIADAFLNPYETAFGISEILNWFKEDNVRHIDSFPSIKLGRYLSFLLVETYWMISLKGNVFVIVGKKPKD